MITLTDLFPLIKELTCIIAELLKKFNKDKKDKKDNQDKQDKQDNQDKQVVSEEELACLEDSIDRIIEANRASHQLYEEACTLLVSTYLLVYAYIDTPIGVHLMEILEDEAYMLLENLKRIA